MAEDYQGDPNIAVPQQASASQIAALKKQYTPQSVKLPTNGKTAPPETPLIGKEAAAKTLQSATFGFGADVARVLVNKQAEQTIRQMSANYDKEHPLAGFAIDLAVAGAMSAVPVLGQAKDAQVAATGLKMVGKAALTGSAYGALTGAGAGGDAEQRVRQATEGGVLGAVGGAGSAYVGAALRPVLQKLGLSSADRGAAGAIQQALKKEGKTPAELDAFMKANPNARIADFSKEVEDAIGKAGSLTNKTSRALGDTVRADKEQQGSRIVAGAQASQPLARTKQQMIDNIESVQKQMKAAYTQSKSEIVAITPQLQKILDHPEVKPVVEKAIKDFGAGKRAGVADLQATPKYKTGAEIPSAALDDAQKALGRAAEDEGAGSIRYGTLKAAQQALKAEHEKTGNIADARALAARLGGEDSQTGLLGAEAWGHQYAFGLKSADIDQFHAMNPEQKEYAKLGMVSGLEKYLLDHGRMQEGALNKISDKLRDPAIEQVLGKKTANEVRVVFEKEAARARVNARMESGGNKKAAFHEENEARMASHVANVAVGGAGHAIGTGLRLLSAKGISQQQALAMIDIATKPGGAQRLQRAIKDKTVLDTVLSLARLKGAVPGKLMEEGNLAAQR